MCEARNHNDGRSLLHGRRDKFPRTSKVAFPLFFSSYLYFCFLPTLTNRWARLGSATLMNPMPHHEGTATAARQ